MTPKPCPNPEGHQGHMQMNGECPWCGAFDESQIRAEAEWDFQDADTEGANRRG